MSVRETESLRELLTRFGSPAQGDPDRLAHAVKRLRAFLAGCGAEEAHVDQAVRLLVDTHLDGDAS